MRFNNKKIARILFFCVVGLSLCSCSRFHIVRRKVQNIDTSLARVLVRGKLIVGVRSLPPYVVVDSAGNFSGFDIEAAREVARLLNVDIEFVPVAWSQVRTALQENQIDCLWGGSVMSDFIGQYYIFSEPYINSALILAVPEKSDITKFEHATKESIGVLTMADSFASAGILTTRLENFTNLQLYRDLSNAFTDFSNGRLDGLVTDAFTATHFRSTDGQAKTFTDFVESGMQLKDLSSSGKTTKTTSLRIVDTPLKRISYAAVFYRDDITLRDRINEALTALEYNAVLEILSRKWFGSDIVIFGK